MVELLAIVGMTERIMTKESASAPQTFAFTTVGGGMTTVVTNLNISDVDMITGHRSRCVHPMVATVATIGCEFSIIVVGSTAGAHPGCVSDGVGPREGAVDSMDTGTPYSVLIGQWTSVWPGQRGCLYQRRRGEHVKFSRLLYEWYYLFLLAMLEGIGVSSDSSSDGRQSIATALLVVPFSWSLGHYNDFLDRATMLVVLMIEKGFAHQVVVPVELVAYLGF